MEIFVNPSGEVPIYRQIIREITEAIAGGRLKPGERLTSHRELSEQLVIAPLTVKKAYDELEALGFIETQRGRGTFVSAQLPEADPAQQGVQIRETARRLLTQAHLAGLSLADITKILRDTDRELTGAKPTEKVKP